MTDDVNRTLGVILQRLDDLKEDVTEIRAQTTRTNGRVTDLETANSVKAGEDKQRQRMMRFVGWAITVAVGLMSGTIGVLILGVH